MDVLKVIQDNATLHHAYLIEGDARTVADVSVRLTEQYTQPELYVQEFDSFGIDESRELTRLALMRSAGVQFFVYRAHIYTREAQNALLKLLEEPPANTHFFFIVPSVYDMLPTLRSRAWAVTSSVAHQELAVNTFPYIDIKTRLDLIDEIVKQKDVALAQNVLREVELALAHESNTNAKKATALKHLFAARQALMQTGASLKITLESVALLTPVLSHNNK